MKARRIPSVFLFVVSIICTGIALRSWIRSNFVSIYGWLSQNASVFDDPLFFLNTGFSLIAALGVIWLLMRMLRYSVSAMQSRTSEEFILLATFLAALAATCSAFAAFRQERATFTSILYGKEVEQVSDYFEIASRVGVSIVEQVENLRSNSKVTKEALTKAYNEIAPLVDELDKKNAQLHFILPPAYSGSFDRITHPLIELREEWKLSSSNMNNDQTNDNLSEIVRQLGEYSFGALAKFSEGGLLLEDCLHAQFGEGYTLDEREIGGCHLISSTDPQ